ncbi:hypothetical protein BGZ60DRAFT_530141 [Tricladium varicosporioides]|nr:hypothetical protein BGZ60DRAFT_530141 [Hymenoscyphus varicosporioides]
MLNFSKSALAFFLCITLLLSTYGPASALEKSTTPTRRSIQTPDSQEGFKNRASGRPPPQPVKQKVTAASKLDNPELALLKLLRLERELNNRMERHHTSVTTHLANLNKLLSNIQASLSVSISTLSDLETSIQGSDLNIDTAKLTELYAQFEEKIKSSSDSTDVKKSIQKARAILHEMAGEKTELEAWMAKFNAKVAEEGRKAGVEGRKGRTPTGRRVKEELRR